MSLKWLFHALGQRLHSSKSHKPNQKQNPEKPAPSSNCLALECLESRLVPAGDMALGTNVETMVDWSSAWTFKDAFLSSRPWISHAYNTVTGMETWSGGGEIHLNAKGWATGLNEWTNPQGQKMQQHLGTLMFREMGTTYPAGVYRAEWEGTGSLIWKFAAKVKEEGVMPNGKHYALLNVTPSEDGIYMGLYATSPKDPIRNIHVWLPDYNGQSFAGQAWSPGASFSPFHPVFLEKLKPFSTIRFMDWANTNLSDIKTWADRRPYDYATQESADFQNGVAIEYMIELCNELHANAWFNMPHQADDLFVKNFATLVRDNLLPGEKAYIEWSNETWNWGYGFESFPWISQQLTLPENASLQGDRWAFVAREVKRDFDIWSDVFQGQTDRIVRVVAGQQSNAWIVDQILSHMDGHFDAVSCAAYMYVSDNDKNTFTSATTSTQVINALINNLPATLTWIKENKLIATKYAGLLGRPIPLVAYEGGPHLDAWNAPYQQAFFDAGSNPLMYDAYTRLLNGSKDAGLELFLHFSLTGGLHVTPFGSFGALQSMTQSTNTAPKYRALVDYAMALQQTIFIEPVATTGSEAGPVAASWKVTRTGPSTSALTVLFKTSGTATFTDYSGLPTSLKFAAGETTRVITLTPVDDLLVESTETLGFQIVAGPGYTVNDNKNSVTVSILDNDTAPKQGLIGYYFDNKDLTNLIFSRNDAAIQFNWGTDSPDQRIAKDTFSVLWLGQIKVPTTGRYQLRTYSDDGVRLWINGVLAIGNWTNHNATYNTTASLNLTAGQMLDIRLEYYEDTSKSVIGLDWRRPGQANYSAIPTAQWFPPPVSLGPNSVSTRSTAISSGTNLANGSQTISVPDWLWLILNNQTDSKKNL